MVSNLKSVAPYAKAIFALALRDQKLKEWFDILEKLSLLVDECKRHRLLNNPEVKNEQVLSLFYNASGDFLPSRNLVNILQEQKKLELLPSIAAEYKCLFLQQEQILEAKITVARELMNEQKNRINEALKKRYKRQILSQYHVDHKLIGGAVIQINGKVIDGSIMGMLQRLKQNLLSKEFLC